jgi:hypothetical protein
MAIKRPDIYEHNNPVNAFADSNFIRGGFRSGVTDLSELYALSGYTDQLKEHSTVVYVSGDTKYYILIDNNNIGNSNGWNEFKSSDSGTVSGATNGLTLNNGIVSLGGTLTSNTTINGDGQTFTISNINEFQVNTSGNSTILGIDKEGLIFSFSGGSITMDDNGGLKYGGDYSNYYTSSSIPSVGYLTGYTSGNYLKLDQTTSQDICNGQPIFHEGIILDPNPLTSSITGHTKGRMYYDDNYETISVDIGDDSTLQLGQESVRYVYNATGNVIPNGSLVYNNGVHSGSGVDTVTIGLSIATGITEASVIGITTQDIQINDFGFITTQGNVNKLDTINGQFTNVNVGDELYLSSTVAGGITNVVPASPNVNVHIGHLLTKNSVNGKIFVDIIPILGLNDLADVNTSTALVDEILKYNGVEWVNATLGSVSAGNGVNFYYATPIINSRTSPAGISADGTGGNGIQLATLSKLPVTTGSTLIVAGLSASDGRAFAAWEGDNIINKSIVDGGTWEFNDYLYVDNSAGATYLIHQIYQTVLITGSTITITGSSANNRTAIISSNQFTGTYFTASTTNTIGSYLKTPSGIYLISGKTNDNVVNIVVPTGYVNETGVTGNIWNKLFGATTSSIENTTVSFLQTTISAPAFAVLPTDKLGEISFVSASGSYTLSLNYNGTTNTSYFKSPLITLHNDLAGLQGGNGNERYHLSLSELTNLNNQSGTNTGNETTATIESKLTGEIFTHYHPYSGMTGTPDLNQYQTVSEFIEYTASTANIIANAITGVTSHGTGTTIYTGVTDNNLSFNTLVGSGGTTIQKIGDEIIINSSTSTDSQLYVGQSPSAVNLCGITIGYELTGKTISCIMQDLLVPELFGSVTAPSTSAILSTSGTLEIGCVINQTVTGTFNQGCINPQYCSLSPKRSGLPNAYCFTGTGMPSGLQTCTSLSATGTTNSYVIVSGSQTWGVCAYYDAGYPALGSKGTQYCTALSSGNTSAATANITGILPYYYGTSSNDVITNNIVTGGTKVLSNVTSSTPICFNAINQYLWFAAPACAATKTKWWVCAANAGDIGGTGNLWATYCNVNVCSGQGCWSGCAYEVYVTCGVTTTATDISMCLY